MSSPEDFLCSVSGSGEAAELLMRAGKPCGRGGDVSDAAGSHSSLISALRADARGPQQSVRASGFDPEALVSSGMINCPCFCCLVIITGLTCNQFHVALQL